MRLNFLYKTKKIRNIILVIAFLAVIVHLLFREIIIIPIDIYFIILIISLLMLFLSVVLSLRENPNTRDYSSKDFKIPDKHPLTIFLFFVLIKHWKELLAFFMLFVSFSFILLNEKTINDHNFLNLFVAISLSTLSIIVGIIGMYFAHEAENRSKELLGDRSSFFNSFQKFMKKINQELSDKKTPNRPKKYDLYKIEDKSKNITSFYCFKLVLLTPFLGHAGIPLLAKHDIPSGKIDEILDEHIKYMTNIMELSTFYNCCVQIIVPPLNEIFDWYGIIQFLNNLKKVKLKSKKSIKEQIKKNRIRSELYNKTWDYLFSIGNGKYIKTKNGAPFSSFKQYIEEWKNKRFTNISISLREDIPFQGLIVTKYISKRHITKSYSEKIIKKLNNGNKPMIGTSNLLEENKVAYISFVGSSTFKNVNSNLTNPDSKNHGMGLHELFTNLHSTFKSEDPRMLEIFNNHYKQLWDVQKVGNYPKFNFNSMRSEEDIYSDTWKEDKCKKYINDLLNLYK